MPSGLKHSHYWEGPVVPPIPPTPPVAESHSPHDYRAAMRAANPRLRRLIQRGIIPDEFVASDLNEVEELLNLLDDLENLSDLPT